MNDDGIEPPLIFSPIFWRKLSRNTKVPPKEDEYGKQLNCETHSHENDGKLNGNFKDRHFCTLAALGRTTPSVEAVRISDMCLIPANR